MRRVTSPNWTAAPRALALALLFAIGLSTDLAAATKTVPDSREQIQLSFAPVVKQVAPAVVNIYAKRAASQKSRISPLFNDPLFKRFFGEDFGLFGMPQERIHNSLGSGVIIGKEGLIVTNYHVIKGADAIRVVLADRREFPAELVLEDERTDLSVLRINAEGESLPTVDLEDSDAVEVGDIVLAIGNPFGVGQTVTSGIVSALARTQAGISDYSFFIQTDAAINPGNSGGALVTLNGKLIGINTAIYSRTGGSIGIGFAIPSNMVRTVIMSALDGGRVVRPWSGLIGQSLTADLAEAFGLDRASGVIVSKVYVGGPAEQAGLRMGDVILSLDKREIHDLESLRYRVATRELGSSAEVEIWRERKKQSLQMTLMRPPENPPRNETLLIGRHPLVGTKVANISPALAEELDLEGTWEGVIITGVQRGGPAHRLGFRPGDIILELNGEAIVLVDDLQGNLDQPAEHWSITISRNGRVKTFEFGA